MLAKGHICKLAFKQDQLLGLLTVFCSTPYFLFLFPSSNLQNLSGLQGFGLGIVDMHIHPGTLEDAQE